MKPYKVAGEENLGDAFTKAGLSESRIVCLLKLPNFKFRDGRAESAPALRHEGGTKVFVLTCRQRQRQAEEKKKKLNTMKAQCSRARAPVALM